MPQNRSSGVVDKITFGLLRLFMPSDICVVDEVPRDVRLLAICYKIFTAAVP